MGTNESADRSSREELTAQQITLCDALDRLFNKGVVIHGDITISVAGVDLLYIGIRSLICAIDAIETPHSLSNRDPNRGIANSCIKEGCAA